MGDLASGICIICIIGKAYAIRFFVAKTLPRKFIGLAILVVKTTTIPRLELQVGQVSLDEQVSQVVRVEQLLPHVQDVQGEPFLIF